MKKQKKGLLTRLQRLLLPGVAFLAVSIFSLALFNLDRGQNEEGRRLLEDSLRRASVSCYAAEGIYPPDLAYLEQHYGVQIDRDRYHVFYEVFGSNLMPSITVLESES